MVLEGYLPSTGHWQGSKVMLHRSVVHTVCKGVAVLQHAQQLALQQMVNLQSSKQCRRCNGRLQSSAQAALCRRLGIWHPHKARQS